MKYAGHSEIHNAMKRNLIERMGDEVHQYAFPPPIFDHMQGEYRHLDLDAGRMIIRFPFFEHYLNPYGVMQGGVIAAAVDNTIGPLSVLLAPPNVTRRLEITYSKPVSSDMEYIDVEAIFKSREGQMLEFRFNVFSPNGRKLVRGKSTNWIIENEEN